MTKIKTALKEGLLALKTESAQIEAEVLLSLVLHCNRTLLYTYPERELTPKQTEKYTHLIQKRILGHPVAYLTGQKEFWSLPLKVTEDTLIPRPETELLVEITLELLKDQSHATVLELGTGSGAIALALAHAQPTWSISAYDKSEPALKVAQDNASLNHMKHIQFGLSDWLQSIPAQRFDAIIANPPYLAENDPHLKEGDLRFEPRSALVSGQDGMDALTQIIKSSPPFLKPGAFLLLEHGCEQKASVSTCFVQSGFQRISHWQDLEGHDRVTGGFWSA